ncbi:hypothetical protein [Pelagibacterium lacus]|uniref:hypothetical protein n=1 Tax=Pelagibacterium lacus TaxID=2282655 RepID=UPI0011C05B22|nr:hypothetical protein [Pelagibacterium lacus]
MTSDTDFGPRLRAVTPPPEMSPREAEEFQAGLAIIDDIVARLRLLDPGGKQARQADEHAS